MASRKSTANLRTQSAASQHSNINFEANPMSSQTCLQGDKAGQPKNESIIKRLIHGNY
jgi:hypothetical protein